MLNLHIKIEVSRPLLMITMSQIFAHEFQLSFSL